MHERESDAAPQLQQGPLDATAAEPVAAPFAPSAPRLSPAAVERLQRTAGNHAVTHFLARSAAAADPPPPHSSLIGKVRTPTLQRFDAQHLEHAERGVLSRPGAGGTPGFTD